MRSIYLQKNKSVFKLEGLPIQRFAESLGLPGAPKIKFLSKELAAQKKNASRTVAAAQAEVLKEKADDSDDDLMESSDESDEETTKEQATKLTKVSVAIILNGAGYIKICSRRMAFARNTTACSNARIKTSYRSITISL